MNEEQKLIGGGLPRRRLARVLIVLAGLILGQFILYGPSLCGRRILLPLDILAYDEFYLPRTPEVRRIEVQNVHLQDLVCLFEPARRFGASEVQAGRLPMWNPLEFGGIPFFFAKFSPFFALELCTPSPVIVAWAQLLAGLVAGFGAYAFFRRVLSLSFWPAAIAAWCYPLTAFFVFWQGYQTGAAAYWLPWMLLAVDRTTRGRGVLAPLGLSLATGLTLVSGQLDVAGQVLLASGLYAAWSLLDRWRLSRAGQERETTSPKPAATPTETRPQGLAVFPKRRFSLSWKGIPRAAFILVLAWTLGILLAAPHILPVIEYSLTGARITLRNRGNEERPPVGLAALPQTVLPEMYGAYGANKTGSLRYGPDIQMESSATAYSGMFATLVFAPLAWYSRRHRSINVFWLGLTVFALSWCLNLPGFVQILRLPGLNLMSHNRLVFLVPFAVLAMTAVGLEVFLHGPVPWRRWLWAFPALTASLYVWCAYRTLYLPEPIATQVESQIQKGRQVGWVRDLQSLRRVQDWFVHHYAVAALLCAIATVIWLFLRSGRSWQARLLPLAGALLVVDLLWFDYGRNPQSDPALYFPPLPVLQQVAKFPPGRVIGFYTLPANLANMCGLADIRGYDGVDPIAMVELLELGADPQSPSHSYTLIQYLLPLADLAHEGGIRLSPVFDMLGVRYVICRGSPLPDSRPAFQGTDYWVLVNSNALPRAFVPQRVEVVPDKKERLRKLGSPQFAPREVAYVESAVNLPSACRGSVEISGEIPTRVTLALHMETPGLVILADRWDAGWRAYLNGNRVPILRVNHAIRGVLAPAGSAALEFRYEPASFAWGLRLAALAAAVLDGWLAFLVKSLLRRPADLLTLRGQTNS